LPIALDLPLPIITPSGFNIGIITNISLCLRYLYNEVLFRQSYFIILAKMIELFDSPGCTLPVIKITFLLFIPGRKLLVLFYSSLVIFYPKISMGISMPVED